MILFCKSCKFNTTMEYDFHCHNFICQSCNKLLIGRYGHEILDLKRGDLKPDIIKDMFIHLNLNGILKFLKKLSDWGIWISMKQ